MWGIVVAINRGAMWGFSDVEVSVLNSEMTWFCRTSHYSERLCHVNVIPEIGNEHHASLFINHV